MTSPTSPTGPGDSGPETTRPSLHQQETGSTAQGVTRWRKRPVTVEAVQWTGDNAIELAAFTGSRFDVVDPGDRGDDPDITAQVFDVLHSTWVGLHTGHWVIRGVRGEFYPCDDGVLAETYEPAGGDHITVSREDLRMAAAIADRMNVADSDGVHAQMTAPEMAVFDRLSAAAEVTR